MIKVKIERYYTPYRKPCYLTCRTHSIKKANQDFSTLADLKEFYGITKLIKCGTGWALNNKGNTIEWPEYEAEISDDYIVKQ